MNSHPFWRVAIIGLSLLALAAPVLAATVVIKVNGAPITDIQIAQRAALKKLEKKGGTKEATDELINEAIDVSEADIDTQARAKLTAANSFDYILKEVLFLMPGGKGDASARTAQANKYRKAFTGCANAVQESLNYTDAAVRDIGRRHATQMEPAIADELSKLDVGGITKPRVVAGGVSMLIICAKETSEDTTFLANQVRQQTGNGALQKEADKYLADLKAKAQIIRG